MKDAYERRVLRLHLSRKIRQLSGIFELEFSGEAAGEPFNSESKRADTPLLEYVLEHLTVRDFETAAQRKVYLWP
jgi:hypothetical protein